MNDEIKILYDEKKVILSSEVLDKLSYLAKMCGLSSYEKELINSEIDSWDFHKVIERIMSSVDISIKFLPSENNEINYDTDLMYFLVQQYKEKESKEEIEKGYFDVEYEAKRLYELLNIMYQLRVEVNNYHLIRDLINAKNDCLKNMKYYLNSDTILQFNDEYEKAIQNKDTKKMLSMLNSVQQDILKEWEKYVSNIDSMSDDNFAFIGHSTSSTKFDGPFYDKYVSSSLFNQDLTATYNCGYGFILAPKNIVGANSSDMYVKNAADSQDDLLFYSTIKKIHHPQRVIDECLLLQKEYMENGENKGVYSEVVIEGFEPIGIFCFTDGSKNLNFNYRGAKQLQDSFPHLKIYDFDTMKRKKGDVLDQSKLSLLNSLQRQFTNHTFDIGLDRLSSYDYFFEEYEKLKQKGEYTEEEIGTIFKNNEKLLSIFDTDPDNLFNGMWDEKQIKYILGKNTNYNIDYILSGKAKAFALNRLKSLYPYKDKLNSIYDGLSEFLDLVSRMEITDEMMTEINSSESINFYMIAKVLASKMNEQAQQNLSNYQMEYNELIKEVHERTNIKEQYEYYYPIYLERFYVDFIKNEYAELINDINVTEQRENELQTKLNKIVNDLNERDKMAIEEIHVRLSNLYKHPFINRKKIIEEKNRLKYFEEKDMSESLSSEFSEKSSIEFELRYVQSEKKRFYDELEVLKHKIRDKFKCESIDEIELVISEAEKIVSQYDSMNEYYLMNLNIRLEKLTNRIIKEQSILNVVQEEATTVSKSA